LSDTFTRLDAELLVCVLLLRFTLAISSWKFIIHLCRFFQRLDLCIRLPPLRRQQDFRFNDRPPVSVVTFFIFYERKIIRWCTCCCAGTGSILRCRDCYLCKGCFGWKKHT